MRSFGLNEIWYMLQATQWTLYLSILTFVLGGSVGFFIALARCSRSRLLRAISGLYIQIFQSTPLLMQLFLIFFGLSLIGFRLPVLVAGSIALTFWASAFLGEIWRGCIEAVPEQQTEAADSLALTPWQQLRYVILPQASKIALPPTIGFFVQIIKNTSLTSIIGVTELMRASTNMNNATFEPMKVLAVASLIYFATCYPLSLISR